MKDFFVTIGVAIALYWYAKRQEKDVKQRLSGKKKR
jgi:hypothetical protein